MMGGLLDAEPRACVVGEQAIIEQYGLENLLLGMTSQLSEREDHIIVDDLRGE